MCLHRQRSAPDEQRLTRAIGSLPRPARPVPIDSSTKGGAYRAACYARADPHQCGSSQPRGIGEVAHVPEHRSRCVTIADCGPRARSADLAVGPGRPTWQPSRTRTAVLLRGSACAMLTVGSHAQP
jgi:hypothetical protein